MVMDSSSNNSLIIVWRYSLTSSIRIKTKAFKNMLKMLRFARFSIYVFKCRIGYSIRQNENKTFRERQHPRPADLRKCEHWLSAIISNRDPLHGTLYHATKISGHIIISSHFTRGVIVPHTWSKPIMENLKVPWNVQNWPSMASLYSDLIHGSVHHSTKFQANSCNP